MCDLMVIFFLYESCLAIDSGSLVSSKEKLSLSDLIAGLFEARRLCLVGEPLLYVCCLVDFGPLFLKGMLALSD